MILAAAQTSPVRFNTEKNIEEHIFWIKKAAKKNADFHDLQINFILDNIINPDYSKYPEKFDLIVSNPPYVRESEKKLMNNNVLA